MKVTTVTATIKYSQDARKGAWKAVEIGAEATVDANETWQTSQAHLYADLGQQLKALWSNGQKAPEKPVEPADTGEATETPAHYCQEHQAAFKRYSRGDSVWWSHKTADGKWCREKQTLPNPYNVAGPWGSLRGPLTPHTPWHSTQPVATSTALKVFR